MKPAKDMTDDEMKVAVLELSGWRKVDWRQPGTNEELWTKDEPADNSHGVRCYTFWNLPNCPKSLDAMHEAELYLQREAGPMVWLDYVDALRRLSDMTYGGANSVVSATARQKAEAFVETMRE